MLAFFALACCAYMVLHDTEFRHDEQNLIASCRRAHQQPRLSYKQMLSRLLLSELVFGLWMQVFLGILDAALVWDYFEYRFRGRFWVRKRPPNQVHF